MAGEEPEPGVSAAPRIMMSKESIGDGVRLRAAVVIGAVAVDIDGLRDIELATKGDTSIGIEGDELVGRRLLVGPKRSELTDAGYELAKRVLMAHTVLSASVPEEEEEVALPPTFPPVPGLDAILALYMTVRSVVPAWATADASTPTVRELHPGELLSELARQDDWSKVSCDDGSVVYMDSRALVPYSRGAGQ